MSAIVTPVAGTLPARSASAPVPWYIWCCALAVLSGSVGGAWDISWHESIGRDTFWTPAHMAIYACGVLAGIACGYLILSTTFGAVGVRRAAAVRIWGFHGPLGAFLCAWGGVAMITSAPFDNWWHNAYGLDVKILSPPHVLLILGMLIIRVGALLLVIGEWNRRGGTARGPLYWVLLYLFAAMIATATGTFQEMMLRNFMHSARFYLLASLLPPLFLAAVGRLGNARWPCTATLALYTGLYIALMQILPLFPAQPKLGPVYQNAGHFIPPQFPLLLIAPALALDLLRPRLSGRGTWLQAAVMGVAFLAVFIAAQWPFADFLMSPASRNRIFATQDIPFFVPSTTDWVRNVFTQVEQTGAEFWRRMAIALIVATASARLGLGFGDWLRRVKR